ncbi:MAG: hypothetical protein C0429_09725 [Sphingopyxis sp.]|nr:hypothetical protein [Sphingopyxis sp.]
MSLIVTHNGTDITDEVSGLEINDERNSNRNTARFIIEKQPGGFTPVLNAEIIITLNSERIFGGSILSLETSVEAVPTVNYEVECVDFSYQLDRKLVTERYTGFTAEDIIIDLVSAYAPTYTTTGVNAAVEISSIAFNRLTLSECLDKLAKITNHLWYVDYFKNVYFFSRNGDPAPFGITDTSNNYIISSLRIKSDLSQLRNKVLVQGAEQPADSTRTTLHAGDGEKTEFPTNFKFDELPDVLVDGVSQTVGVEYLDTTGFDCYWSRQEKYVRFDITAIPPEPTAPDTTNISITGYPLVPVITEVPDNESISEFGEFEHFVKESTLTTQDETISRGIAELDAYAAELTEASFDTYTAGLRTGQLISIDSDMHGVDADYVIQSVKFRPFPNGSSIAGVWSVKLASAASLTLVEALRSLLKKEELSSDEMEVLLAFYRFSDRGVGTDDLDDATYTERPYYLADAAGVVTAGEPFICNYAVLEA